MADRQWFVANGNKQDGPYSDERLRELIAGGTVTADTLVWCEGMSAWAKAAAIPGLLSATARPPVLPGSPATTAAATDPHGQALSTNVRVWPLLGRVILVGIGQILVIPTPWVATSFLRWFVDHIELPGQQRVAFAGKPGDIWYVFMLNALCAYGSLINSYVQLALIFLTALFTLIIARWFYANLIWEGRPAPLQFTGSYWAMLGWTVLLPLSAITIIGWAWVATAATRWMCRNVIGAARQLIFTASGWSYLWRTLVFALTAILIVPIPWTLHWYTRWIVSQFALTNAQLMRA